MLDLSNIVYKLPIDVDVSKIMKEIDDVVIPDISQDQVAFYNRGCSVTGTADTKISGWFRSNSGTMTKMYDPNTRENLTKNYKKYNLGFPGPWREGLIAGYNNGVTDKDLVHWHPDLVGSEMFDLRTRIADFLGVSDQMRCRISFLKGPFSIDRHGDPHTPWRVHVNLKTGPNTQWVFYDAASNQSIQWHQPTDGVYLIRTGDIQHGVEVGAGEIRWQIFYHIWQSNLGPAYYQDW